jgi:hypothetical protein
MDKPNFEFRPKSLYLKYRIKSTYIFEMSAANGDNGDLSLQHQDHHAGQRQNRPKADGLVRGTQGAATEAVMRNRVVTIC